MPVPDLMVHCMLMCQAAFTRLTAAGDADGAARALRAAAGFAFNAERYGK